MKNILLPLLFTTIGGLVNGQTIQWTFNSGPDGWVLTNSLSGTVGSGVYDITITGADPFMHSPNNVNINASAMGQVKIRLQNITPDTQYQLFWITNADNTWNQSKSVLFPVNANDITQTDYIVTLLGNTQWSGTIKQLRLDLGNANTSGNVKIDEIDVLPLEFGLDNGILHLRLDLSRGGSISYISKSSDSRSIVNIADEGRYVQQSYYAGIPLNRQAEGQNPAWSPWTWNPIQVGDSYLNRAQILNYQQNTDTLYVKCTPMLWDMNNMPAEAEMEQWTILDSNAVKVKNRLTCHRTDTIYGEGIFNNQELPAVYPISALKNLYSYFGTAPFTNAPLDNPPVVNLSSGFWGVYMNDTVTENWMAFVNDTLWGMGVYKPLNPNFLAGMAGSPGYEATDGSTSYIAPVKLEALMKNSVYEYTYYLVIGTLGEIRTKIYAINADSVSTDAAQPAMDKETISVNPNPTRGVFNVQMSKFENVQMKIYNVYGECVHQHICTSAHQQIDLSEAPKGIYFIRINDSENVITKKLIIE
ncbi:MAG: T9SS type A sorting domain-containing protein [Bacteroidetes bacterium]|nr:T9SS type A sorting domain-containing protein [Bacteroidota bacterium]